MSLLLSIKITLLLQVSSAPGGLSAFIMSIISFNLTSVSLVSQVALGLLGRPMIKSLKSQLWMKDRE